MFTEMNQADMAEYVLSHPGMLPIHIGGRSFRWRSFLLQADEVNRLKVLEQNLDPNGKENIRYHRFISKNTGIPLRGIDSVLLQFEVLTVIPIIRGNAS